MALKNCSKLRKLFVAEVGVYPHGPNHRGV
jgi:hypothetical protein